MMIGKAKRDVMRAQELVNIVVVPWEMKVYQRGSMSRKNAKRSRFLEN